MDPSETSEQSRKQYSKEELLKKFKQVLADDQIVKEMKEAIPSHSRVFSDYSLVPVNLQKYKEEPTYPKRGGFNWRNDGERGAPRGRGRGRGGEGRSDWTTSGKSSKLERWNAGDEKKKDAAKPAKPEEEAPIANGEKGDEKKGSESVAPAEVSIQEVKPVQETKDASKPEAPLEDRFSNAAGETNTKEETEKQPAEEEKEEEVPRLPQGSYGRGRGRALAKDKANAIRKAPAPDFEASPITKKEVSPKQTKKEAAKQSAKELSKEPAENSISKAAQNPPNQAAAASIDEPVAQKTEDEFIKIPKNLSAEQQREYLETMLKLHNLNQAAAASSSNETLDQTVEDLLNEMKSKDSSSKDSASTKKMSEAKLEESKDSKSTSKSMSQGQGTNKSTAQEGSGVTGETQPSSEDHQVAEEAAAPSKAKKKKKNKKKGDGEKQEEELPKANEEKPAHSEVQAQAPAEAKPQHPKPQSEEPPKKQQEAPAPQQKQQPGKKKKKQPQPKKESSSDEDEPATAPAVLHHKGEHEHHTKIIKKKQEAINYAQFSTEPADVAPIEKQAAASLEEIMKQEEKNPEAQPHYEPAPKNYFEAAFDEAVKGKKKKGKASNNIDKIMEEQQRAQRERQEAERKRQAEAAKKNEKGSISSLLKSATGKQKQGSAAAALGTGRDTASDIAETRKKMKMKEEESKDVYETDMYGIKKLVKKGKKAEEKPQPQDSKPSQQKQPSKQSKQEEKKQKPESDEDEDSDDDDFVLPSSFKKKSKDDQPSKLSNNQIRKQKKDGTYNSLMVGMNSKAQQALGHKIKMQQSFMK